MEVIKLSGDIIEELNKVFEKELPSVNLRLEKLEKTFQELKSTIRGNSSYQALTDLADQSVQSPEEVEKFSRVFNQIKELTSTLSLEEEARNDVEDLMDEEAQSHLNTISKDFSSLITKLNQANNELEEIKRENETLIKDLDFEGMQSNHSHISGLEKRLDMLQQDNSNLETRFLSLKEQYNELEEKNKQTEEKFSELSDLTITQTEKIEAEKRDLEEKLEYYKNKLNEKEEEILSFMTAGNSESQVNIQSHTELTYDELLLKLSEMEMEEANWQDEKKLLYEKVEQLQSAFMNTSSLDELNEEIKVKDGIIDALRAEVSDLQQDLDEADEAIDQLSLENDRLRKNVEPGVIQSSEKDISPSSPSVEKQSTVTQLISNLLPNKTVLEFDQDESNQGESEEGSEALLQAMSNAGVLSSLVDKFLKPSVQVTYLVKQGDWDYESLAETASITKKELKSILKELASNGLIQYDDYRIWWTGE